MRYGKWIEPKDFPFLICHFSIAIVGQEKAGHKDAETIIMKLFRFSFKFEPIWMLVFSLGPGVLVLVIVLFLVLILKFVH